MIVVAVVVVGGHVGSGAVILWGRQGGHAAVLLLVQAAFAFHLVGDARAAENGRADHGGECAQEERRCHEPERPAETVA